VLTIVAKSPNIRGNYCRCWGEDPIDSMIRTLPETNSEFIPRKWTFLLVPRRVSGLVEGGNHANLELTHLSSSTHHLTPRNLGELTKGELTHPERELTKPCWKKSPLAFPIFPSDPSPFNGIWTFRKTKHGGHFGGSRSKPIPLRKVTLKVWWLTTIFFVG